MSNSNSSTVFQWVETTEERYYDMLGVLPPAHYVDKGFLVGEPMNHRVCKFTSKFEPVYEGYIVFHGKFYQSSRPLTVEEFNRFTKVQNIVKGVVNGKEK